MHDNSKCITIFLLGIFIRSLGGEKGSNKRGARFLDEHNQYISVVDYVRLLFGKLPNTDNAAILQRRTQVNNHFLKVYKTLTAAGWKENTAFEKGAIGNFQKMIIDYKI
jgi:hypothetical protein